MILIREFRVVLSALVLAGLGYLVFANLSILRDLSFFQPSSPSRISQIVIDQVRSGPASRLILIALRGAPANDLARISRSLVEQLSDTGNFRRVLNGTLELDDVKIQVLMEHRYLLGPEFAPDEFGAEGLRQSISNSLARLGSFSGFAMADLLPADPTGRLVVLLDSLGKGYRPHYDHGVWFSQDNTTALVMAESVADGDDEAGQASAQTEIATRFSEVAKGTSATSAMTGPAIFSLLVSRSIQNEAQWISLGSILIAVGTLFLAFRSIMLIVVAMLPTAAGVILGAAAVQLIFGSVHGIALTFGATLVGITVDYPIHVISHLRQGVTPKATIRQIASPLSLGAVTTVAAFVPMTASSFPGLAQLGVSAVVGVAVAALMTWICVPWLLVSGAPSATNRATDHLISILPRARGPLLVLSIIAGLWLVIGNFGLFSDDLSRLSPMPQDLVALDTRLRQELGAPDVRRLIVIEGQSEQEVLSKNEKIAAKLDDLIQQGTLSSYDAPARYLPSIEKQKRRQATLPDPQELWRNLAVAVQSLSISPSTFAPFVRDVTAARNRTPLTRQDLLSLPFLDEHLGSLLMSDPNGGWLALILLSGVQQPERLATEIKQMGDPAVHYLDLQAEAIQLIASYRAEALHWLVVGLTMAALILFAILKPLRAVRVVVALTIAMVLTVTALVFMGISLTPFHLVSLLLVAGMGLDYALFVSHDNADAEEKRTTFRSLVICAVTTTSAFGLMILSSAPILRGIGITVAIGVGLSFVCSLAVCGQHTRSEKMWNRST